MRNTRHTGFVWAILAAAVAAGWMAASARSASAQVIKPNEVRAIRQPQFDIDYQLGDSRANQVELWYTDDKSKSWKFYGIDLDKTSPISFTAPHEGMFGFTVIARNRAGASANNPGPGTEPMFWCFVDWHRPQVQITGPTPPTGEAGAGLIYLKPGDPLPITYTALDDNLTDKPIRIEFRLVDSDTWREIAGNLPNSGKYLWPVPESVKSPFLLRVTAVDQAGNVGPATTLHELEITRDDPRSRIASGPNPPAGGGGTAADRPPTASIPGSVPLPRPPVEVLATMPDAPEFGTLGLLQQPVLPPVAPKYASGPAATPGDNLPPIGPGEVRGVAPVRPVQNATPANEQDAMGMLVVEFTAAEPQPANKLNPTVAKLRTALKPLIDAGQVVTPIAVAMQPLPNSADLIKKVRLYAVIPPSHRKLDQVAIIEATARTNVGDLGKIDGTVITRLERADPVPEPAPAPVPGQGPVVVADTTGPAKAAAGPTLDGEQPRDIALPIPSKGAGLDVSPTSAVKPAKSEAPDDPIVAAAGRQNVELQFGNKQPDLRIDAPPPPAPVPSTPGIITEPPVLPPVQPVAALDSSKPAAPGDKVSDASETGHMPKVGVIGPEPQPVRPPDTGGPGVQVSLGGSDPAVAPGPAMQPKRLEPSDLTGSSLAGRPEAPIDTSNSLKPTATIAPPAPAPGTDSATGNPASNATVGDASSKPVVIATVVRPGDPQKLAAAAKAFRDGLTAYAEGNRPKAAAAYAEAITNDPEMIEAYINLAGLQMLAQEYDKAELNYRMAVDLQQDHPKALFGLGSVQLLRKNPQMAQSTLERLLRIRSSDASAWVLYGDACLGVRENAKAVAAWTEAARLAPDTPVGKLAQERLARYGAVKN